VTAERLRRGLIAASAVARVNVLPGTRSIYRRNDAGRFDEETLMIIKTTAADLAAAREHLLEFHSCEVPEMVALAVADGHDGHLSSVASPNRAL
jgi:periplasmic divalent cation tolerance protein